MTDQDVVPAPAPESPVDIRRLEHENLTRAYGLNLRMLQPWTGLDAPFRGAWCVLDPGDESWPHAHAEHEIFIAMAGRAEVVCGERRYPFAAGDIVRIQAGVEHRVVNHHEENFSYYAIWWDRTMSDEFLGRTEAG